MNEGQVFGNYELVDLLGRGGMGEVWRARHRMLEREAAIKLVRPDALGATGAIHARTLLRRFEREAKATSLLESPHTIQLFDYGVTEDGTFYYAMELLLGLNFKQLVDEYGPVGASRTVYLLRQVCESLEEAHHRGLIHRDMKPANAYLCRLGLRHDFVKVLDFGLVKSISGSAVEGSHLTTDDMAPGSPAFLAPEVVSGAVDERTDVYALGCVAYWLLTGQLVFQGATPLELVVAHLERVPEPPSRRAELPVPEALDALVLACLEKDPASRPQAVGEVARRLAECPLDAPWGEERAAGWWAQHRPGPASGRVPPREPPPPRAPVPPAELSAVRAEAVEALKTHFVSSHLDVAEYERRTLLAARAQTPEALEQLVHDLPVPQEERALVERGPLLPAHDPGTPRLVSVLSGTHRKGPWRVPPELEVLGLLGGARLDFRDAVLGPGCTVIHCRCVLGGVDIIVPPDLYVEVDGWGVLGAFAPYKGSARYPTGDEPWLRLTGWMVLGGVSVKVAPRRAR